MPAYPDAAVEVSLRRWILLSDLNALVGTKPSYWIQLRVAGRGIRVAENWINDLFSEVGLRSEGWPGIAGSGARLGIFGTIDAPINLLSTPCGSGCSIEYAPHLPHSSRTYITPHPTLKVPRLKRRG
jgi:hypothetical protein